MDTEALKKSLLKRFMEVTADRLTKIQQDVLALEKSPSSKALDDVARELHTMKGEARMLGLPVVGELAHAAEDVLRAGQEGKAPARVAADLLLRTCDALSALLEDEQTLHQGTPASTSMLRALVDLVRQPNVAAPSAVSKVAPESPTGSPSADRKPASDRSIRVNVELLDQLGLATGDLLVESARARLRAEELGELLDRFSQIADQFLRAGEGLPHGQKERGLFEGLERELNGLRDDSFRFVRRHVDGTNSLHGNLAQLADHVAEARLVPLSTVFEAFPRAVRDIAQQQGKEVELAIENRGVGVDRSMLADVRDALIHLVRNAVDHGLEAPRLRETSGKPVAGKLSIRVRAEGDMLHVEVEDDGLGIDPDKLREAAVSKGLMTRAQAAGLSDREAIHLIFRPGFSTRNEVNEWSGRGVGLDVVKRKVEAMGGSVQVGSQAGVSTTFHLRLPQSLALMRVLLVRLGDDVYGMPAADVEAVTRVRAEERREVFGTLSIQHRGRPTTLVSLGPLLGLNGGPRHDRPPAVIVRHGEDHAALVVDGLVDEREVAVKPCGGEFLKGAPFIAGTAALEDGRIAALLRIPDVMAEVRRLSQPVAEGQAVRRLRVLLVDDSPIARATQSALIRSLGHVVEEAQNGEEGWAMAQSGRFDLILTDVQMPKLDGIALTRKLKADPASTRVPVIVLSSLASPQDRRRGLDAGADAYLVKGELDVESLAQTIARLT